jgi:predicted enzyme related to lactoylglutathione lyase
MTEGVKTILYPVKDLDKAKAVFTALLGVEPAQDAPYYVGYELGSQHVGLVPNSPSAGPVSYYHVADIKGTVQALIDAGAQTNEEVKNVGGGRLVGTVRDADGNVIGLIEDTARG